jgi:hypothetical protein
VQVAESRVSDLTNRLALAEEKVTALKGERSRLYQQLAESSSASRTQVCENAGIVCMSGLDMCVFVLCACTKCLLCGQHQQRENAHVVMGLPRCCTDHPAVWQLALVACATAKYTLAYLQLSASQYHTLNKVT